MAGTGGQYGFSFNMDGNALAELKKIEAELNKLRAEQKATVDAVTTSNKEVVDSFKQVGEAIVAAFAIDRIIEFGNEILHLTAEFQAFDNVIKYSSLNTVDAQENFQFLKTTITDLKLPMRETMQGFSELQAGMIGTGIEGAKLRTLFLGLSTASTVLHLSAYNFQRAQYALKEIGEVGLNSRYIRELRGSLPGINEIVKETFHKSFEELREEKITGVDFLSKIGEGLQQHFAPGVENATHSLQSEMNATVNAYQSAMLELGKNLEPVFIGLMHDIQDAFNSAPVQWFIANIKEIINVVTTAGGTWLVYKGILLTTDLITKTFAIDNGILTVSMGELTFMTDGTTIAVEGLGAAFDAIGIGLIALGIYEIVDSFLALEKEIDAATDKYTHFKDLSQKQKGFREQYESVATEMRGNLTKDEKNEVFNEITANMKQVSENIDKKLAPSLDAATKHLKDFDKPLPRLQGESDVDYGFRTVNREKERKQLANEISGLQFQMRDQNRQLQYYQNFKNTLTKEGATGKINYHNLGDGVTGNATNSTDLSGAKGGLSEAKQIYISIGTIQRIDKVEAGSDWKHASEIAGEQIAREINNLALSQSSTF